MADFGIELSCTTDIAADSRMVSGFRVVAEAVFRRWTTPRGRLINYPNYGYDVTQHVNQDMSARDINEMCANLAAEAKKEQRVTGAAVVAVLGSDGVLTVTGTIDTAQGPFTMTVAASAVSVQLLAPS